MNPITINATDLPDAWHRCLFSILDVGREFTIDRGSYAGQKRLEFDYITVNVNFPGTRPLIPKIPAHLGIPDPVSDEYLENYYMYMVAPGKKKNEDYTYGDRLHDQILRIAEIYSKHGERNNQCVLQVAQPSDLDLADPPCLRHIDTRIQDGLLHFFPYYRSWDLWGGFPANLAAIRMLQEDMAELIGVGAGKIIAGSKGLHLYDHVWDLARKRRRGIAADADF
ncbi:MAG: thymidylate synthase [Syntrophobacteraceae bacterium]|nr:thymidylate synthase [Desulfobacteraceae bacterium]